MLWNPQATEDRGPPESGGIVDKLRTLGAAGLLDPALPARAASASSCCRGRLALARRSRCSPTRRSWRWASPARRATACRGTSCSRSPPGRRSGGRSTGGGGAREGRPRPPDPRDRRVGAASADAAAGAGASTGSSRCSSGSTTPAGRVEPFYRELGVESVRLAVPARPRPRARAPGAPGARAPAPDVVHTHLVHADVYGALGAGRRALVSTKHNDDRFRRGPFRFVERAVTRKASRVIAITEALRRFCVDEVGLPRGEGRGRPLRARRAAGAVGRLARGAAAGRRARAALRLAARRSRRASTSPCARSRACGRSSRGRCWSCSARARSAPQLAGEGVYLPGPRRRRRGVVPARGAARPPGALGGLRARAARGDARRRSRWSRRGSARSRRSSSTARPACSSRRTTRTRSPTALLDACSPTRRERRRWARPAWRGREAEFSVAKMAERTAASTRESDDLGLRR